MYMRNRDKYKNYSISGFPPNYSGQYSRDSLKKIVDLTDDGIIFETREAVSDDSVKESEHEKDSTHDLPVDVKEGANLVDKPPTNSNPGLLSSIFGKKNDGAGLLSGIFGKHSTPKDSTKDGFLSGILSNIEFEDLILIAVIIFLLKDGIEEDLLLILAIILLT